MTTKQITDDLIRAGDLTGLIRLISEAQARGDCIRIRPGQALNRALDGAPAATLARITAVVF